MGILPIFFFHPVPLNFVNLLLINGRTGEREHGALPVHGESGGMNAGSGSYSWYLAFGPEVRGKNSRPIV